MRLYSIGIAAGIHESILARVTTSGVEPMEIRKDYVFLWNGGPAPNDLAGYAGLITPNAACPLTSAIPIAHSLPRIDHLADGDVIRLDPNGHVRTLYRKNSPNNFILVTEQCNSFCLMCSQPPKQANDFHHMAEHFRLIDLIDPSTKEVVITGGEPTLLTDDFIRLIEHCKNKLPNTAIHVLTNGRLFYYRKFAEKLGSIRHPDLMLGIPIYSDVDSEHDYVVQAKGAFEETVIGLQHLARYDVPVEIRVVVHALTFQRLRNTAEFIARNFPFAVQVALMGMEMVGFVHKNLDELWIDPHDYQQELRDATRTLALAGLRVQIYNHQLCILDRQLWPFARKSISDWKNIYIEECDHCDIRQHCGGFFESAAKRHSAHIKPISCSQKVDDRG